MDKTDFITRFRGYDPGDYSTPCQLSGSSVTKQIWIAGLSSCPNRMDRIKHVCKSLHGNGTHVMVMAYLADYVSDLCNEIDDQGNGDVFQVSSKGLRMNTDIVCDEWNQGGYSMVASYDVAKDGWLTHLRTPCDYIVNTSICSMTNLQATIDALPINQFTNWIQVEDLDKHSVRDIDMFCNEVNHRIIQKVKNASKVTLNNVGW